MITNQEYEELFLIARKMVRFVNLLTEKADCNSELYKYMESIGCEFSNNRTLKGFVQLFIEEDILNCYFYLNYQQTYHQESFILFNTMVYSFNYGNIPWAYDEYLNIEYTNRDYFNEVFDIVKRTMESTLFPIFFIILSKVESTKADEYISILQKIAITLSKNQPRKKKRIDERIDILLSNPKLFICSNDENIESQQIENEENETIVNNIGYFNNEHCSMELLKDKFFNGINFEIIKEVYREGYSNPFTLIFRITNYNDNKKKIGVKMKYISIDYGLKDGVLWDFGHIERFLQDNSFVDVEVSFGDIKKARDGDRIELLVNDGKFASLRLVRERNQWMIVESVERSTFNRELKSKIEHFEAIEEQYGITLQQFSVKAEDENSMKLFCELLALNGELPKEDFTINLAIYDNNNDIVYTDSESKYAEDFKGFEVLTFDRIRLDITVDEISKIRIYPTR